MLKYVFNPKPNFVSDKKANKKEDIERQNLMPSINVDLNADDELTIISAAGPYMINGTILYNSLLSLIDVAKSKGAHVLILVNLEFCCCSILC